MSLKDRIDELCALKAGWLNGHGEAVELEPEYVMRIVKAMVDMTQSQIGIFPTPDGCLQLEWFENGTARTLVIES